MNDSIVTDIEAELADLSRALTEPGERECLRCYVLRMLHEFGCDGTLRWAKYWRDLRAPRAQALARKLAYRGGHCDCEVIFNVYPRYPQTTKLQPCAGVSRRGCTKPCALGPP
ncbi:DUF2695 domain-containing protein [Phytoactinopolyspora halotolerans]|uniref:DUF2695 domain-containing protein n=1 Tax=Phytoactinopolyspora halotolerans TaxID=1981512 RepID=A0A6L9SCK9_9ACTN|nr:DUF2695 domain-containing protein [Phytoactinopolyspora halotolerans]